MFTVNISLVVLFFILLIYLGLLVRNNQLVNQEILVRARSYFDHIVLARRWNAGYGGVFVEKKPGMTSNPYLEKPDIKTVDGLIYTKKNPALMTREISKLAEARGLFTFRITSLKPLNPENRADEFERRSLILFDKGKKEYSEEIQNGEKTLFRYMGPLYVETSCLQCHAAQGYTIGQVRGGISVSFDVTRIHYIMSWQQKIIIAISTFTALFLVVILYFIVRRLMNKIRELYNRIELLSLTDELTGLYNRRYLAMRLVEEYDRAARHSRSIAFIMSDVDFFKKINDSYGHQAGDMVLREIAIAFKKELRKSDVLVRYGGEEIAVILPETSLDNAFTIGEKIRKKIESLDLIVPDGEGIRISISIGVAGLVPERGNIDGADELVRMADQALYRAKENGRNRCEKSVP